MDLTTTILALVAILLASSVNDVSGIYCFQCNSLMDPECENISTNDTSSRFYRPCETTPSNAGTELFCRKTVQLIIDRERLVRVIRSCGWIIHPKLECYSVVNKGHEDTSCQCFYDGCNSATIKTPSIAFISGLCLLIPMYKYLMKN